MQPCPSRPEKFSLTYPVNGRYWKSIYCDSIHKTCSMNIVHMLLLVFSFSLENPLNILKRDKMMLFWQLPIEQIKEGWNYSALGVDPAQLSRKLVLPSYIPPEVPWFWDAIHNIYIIVVRWEDWPFIQRLFWWQIILSKNLKQLPGAVFGWDRVCEPNTWNEDIRETYRISFGWKYVWNVKGGPKAGFKLNLLTR